MKKNGMASVIKPLPHPTKQEKVTIIDEEDDSLPTTEEVDEDDESNEGYELLEAVLIETVRNILSKKYDSLEQLILILKKHKDHRIIKLTDHLSHSGITTTITPKSLFNSLMKFIILYLKVAKIKIGEDIKTKHLNQRNDLKFFLSVFNFNPNMRVTEKKHDKLGLNILMIACENTKNPLIVELLVKELKADIHDVSHDGRRYSPLHIACEMGNLKAVEILVEAGANINAGKFTPLGIALSEKNHDIVTFLLSQKTIDASQFSGDADPYLLAAQYGTANNFLAIMTKKGVDPNVTTISDESALSIALSRAQKARPDNERDLIIRILLKASRFTLNIDLPANGETPLFIASRLGNLFALNLLLEKGANCNYIVNRGVYKGFSVLGIAIYEGNLEIVSHLLEICDLNFVTRFFITSLNKQFTLLGLATANPDVKKEDKDKHANIFTLLKKKWVELNPEQVRTYINKLIKDENILELRCWKTFLLSHNSNIPETGNTPLHVACSNGKVSIIHFLVSEIGVPLNTKNNTGDTPMHLACKKKKALALSALLDLGADPEQENDQKETPFIFAKKSNNEACIRAFIQYLHTMGNKMPSLESARANNDTLLASIIEEFITPKKLPIGDASAEKTVISIPAKNKNKKRANKITQKSTAHHNNTNQKSTEPLSPEEILQSNDTENHLTMNDITPPLPTLPSQLKISSSTDEDISPPLEDRHSESEKDERFAHDGSNADETAGLPDYEIEETPDHVADRPTEDNITEEENSSFIEIPSDKKSPQQSSHSDSEAQEKDDNSSCVEQSEHSSEEDNSEETRSSHYEDSSEIPSTHSHENNDSEEENEGENTSSEVSPSELIVVAVLETPQTSPTKFRSCFPQTIWPQFQNETYTSPPSSPPHYVNINTVLYSELKERIDDQLQYICSDPPPVMVKATLQVLIDYYPSLNYFATIGEIPNDDPVLNFIRDLRNYTLMNLLDINTNVDYWQSKAIKLAQDTTTKPIL